MNYGLQQRLHFIDVLAQYQGQVWREPLMAYFGISSANATRDFRLYIKMCPDNLVYDPSTRRYHKTPNFKSLYDNAIT